MTNIFTSSIDKEEVKPTRRKKKRQSTSAADNIEAVAPSVPAFTYLNSEGGYLYREKPSSRLPSSWFLIYPKSKSLIYLGSNSYNVHNVVKYLSEVPVAPGTFFVFNLSNIKAFRGKGQKSFVTKKTLLLSDVGLEPFFQVSISLDKGSYLNVCPLNLPNPIGT